MREYIEKVNHWKDNGEHVALARVVKTWGSSPRPAGSVMFIDQAGNMSGSVSGGCVEGAVVKTALESLKNKSDIRLDYGVSDEDAWSVGLSCGGRIQVFLQSVDFQDETWKKLAESVEQNKSAVLISSLTDGTSSNTLITEDDQVIGDDIPDSVLAVARESYRKRVHETYETEGVSYFIHLFPRKPLLLIIGAAHITVDLVSLGNFYGFETVVIDPRGFFADNTEFNEPPSKIIKSYPSEVLGDYPLDSYTFAAILSHDPKIDDNALQVLLPSDVAYIGALGSRKTHEKRIKRLMEKGISEDMLERINAPIGLGIHAKSAREIALSVIAEIISVKNAFL
jgi:xanthine dehydrogenase accessory factor